MDVVNAIRLRILSISGVSALIGTRAYSHTLPQDHQDYPAVRVQRIGGTEDMHLRGSSATIRARIQVDAIARTRDAAVTVDQTIAGAGDGAGLIGWQGASGGMAIDAVLPEEPNERFDPDELKLFRMQRDYFVTYRR